MTNTPPSVLNELAPMTSADQTMSDRAAPAPQAAVDRRNLASLFDEPTRMPLNLRRVLGLVGSPRKVSELAGTRTDVAMKRLGFDRRLKFQTMTDVPAAQLSASLRERWWAVAERMRSGKDDLDGLLWARSDVIIEDPFLVERLAEAWAVQGSVVLRDAAGAPVFWALSRQALAQWLPATMEAADVEALKARQKGDFPQAELAQALSQGHASGTWSLALALDQAGAGDAAAASSFRGGASLARWCKPAAPLPGLLVVCATRQTKERFTTHTATGQSVTRMKAAGVDVRVAVACENSTGLSKVYNRIVLQEHADRIALFVHDDVWIDDAWLVQRLHEGLLRYDLLGVAGNRQRAPRQPAWAFPQRKGEWDIRSNLLGCVAHETRSAKSDQPSDRVSAYGDPRGPARLLDGVLLAVRMRTLLQSGLRFDERFNFHFYDLDFCRSAEAMGLRMGVWPLAISHQSGGSFGGLDWISTYGTYVGKWQD